MLIVLGPAEGSHHVVILASKSTLRNLPESHHNICDNLDNLEDTGRNQSNH